jgi:hypothetical protein
VSLVFFGDGYSHAILKKPVQGDFRVQSDFGGREELYTAEQGLIAFASRALQAVPHPWVYARVDLVDFDDPKVSEIELIEPDLFLQFEPSAPKRLALAIQSQLMVAKNHGKSTS